MPAWGLWCERRRVASLPGGQWRPSRHRSRLDCHVHVGGKHERFAPGGYPPRWLRRQPAWALLRFSSCQLHHHCCSAPRQATDLAGESGAEYSKNPGVWWAANCAQQASFTRPH